MFSVSLIGKEALVARLKEMPPAVQALLKLKVAKLAVNLQNYIVSQKLHGQVLGRRSGRLAESIHEEAPITDGESVYGRVFQSGDVKYGRIHEYGFHGQETVKQHLRTKVFGREAKVAFLVGPFTRQMNMPERSFMRSSLLDQKAEIVRELQDAVKQGAKQAIKGG